ncbi:MAG: hypothetical protein KDC57_05905 [Saprospiraceae bacterium]|nr:hypothetical protein [Saprospiraceae bacterium]
MNTIYVRTLKHAEHTVFCVADGQKRYFDPQFGIPVPYSSGQQVKRSIMDSLNGALNTPGSPTTFYWDVKKGELSEGEVAGTCNPAHADQLLGGWMYAAKGGKERTLKRRSPLSISAMRALHPKLAGTTSENMTFDRSDRPNNNIIVRDDKGNVLSDEEIQEVLSGKDRSLTRKWIPGSNRAAGLFVMDIAIDLRRLFSVNLNLFEPEITHDVETELRENGWVESENVFGPCLVAPKVVRDKLILALADAILNWKIASNQSRTFSLMETLAVTVSDNANKVASSIRAKLVGDGEKVMPIIEEELDGVKTFVSLPAAGYVLTTQEKATAQDEARAYLIEQLSAFDYENQLQPV